MPILISDYLDICDPVLTFDRFMVEMDLEKYLKGIPKHSAGRIRYNPVSMLKTVLFGFMTNGYISLRELEDSCFETKHVDLQHLYIDGSKFEADSIRNIPLQMPDMVPAIEVSWRPLPGGQLSDR